MFTRIASTIRHAARPQCLLRMPARAITARQTAPRRHLYEHVRKSFRSEILSPGWNKNSTLILVAILLSATGITVAVSSYSYYISFLSKTLHNFPQPVAAELRKALYYAMYDQPQPAVQHFRSALEKCAELRIDPLSDEVTGIKIELAGVLEKYGLREKTVEVLEHVLDEVVAGSKAQTDARERTRLLKRGVGVGLKLGGLYTELKKPAEAEEALVWAVETVLRERGRREKEDTKVEDEGEWLSDEEVSMALENLAAHYEGNDKHFLATPLYLQALSLLPPNICHAVILMNNLSTTLAHHPLPPGGALTHSQLITDSAIPWAEKALAVAATIQPPHRTRECDEGCAAALYNLAEFKEMLGDREGAGRGYREAGSVAAGLDMGEGVKRAQEGARRVGG